MNPDLTITFSWNKTLMYFLIATTMQTKLKTYIQIFSLFFLHCTLLSLFAYKQKKKNLRSECISRFAFRDFADKIEIMRLNVVFIMILSRACIYLLLRMLFKWLIQTNVSKYLCWREKVMNMQISSQHQYINFLSHPV